MNAHEIDEDLGQWLLKWVPIDLGDGVHRAGWVSDGTVRDGDVYWLHECTGGRRQLGMIDVMTGTRHTLTTTEPLHINESILCTVCGDHGFIWGGKWNAA